MQPVEPMHAAEILPWASLIVMIASAVAAVLSIKWATKILAVQVQSMGEKFEIHFKSFEVTLGEIRKLLDKNREDIQQVKQEIAPGMLPETRRSLDNVYTRLRELEMSRKSSMLADKKP